MTDEATDSEIAALAERPRASDPHEVYDDLDKLPDWWRDAVQEFAIHDLRPYRPPRFSDGEITPKAIGELEDEYSIEIRFMAVDPQAGDEWELYVDDTAVAEVARRRHPDGYTIYSMTEDEFRRLVTEAAEGASR